MRSSAGLKTMYCNNLFSIVSIANQTIFSSIFTSCQTIINDLYCIVNIPISLCCCRGHTTTTAHCTRTRVIDRVNNNNRTVIICNTLYSGRKTEGKYVESKGEASRFSFSTLDSLFLIVHIFQFHHTTLMIPDSSSS